ARAAHRTVESRSPGDRCAVGFDARFGDDRSRHLLPDHEADPEKVRGGCEPASVPRQRRNLDRDRGPRARILHHGGARPQHARHLREALQSRRHAGGFPTPAAPHSQATTTVQTGLEETDSDATGSQRRPIRRRHVMTRAVIYARYSSDLQRDASIEDQVRVCKARIKQEAWQLVATYADRAVSGASHLRPGYQKL